MQLLMESWKRFLDEKADPSKVDPKVFPQKLSQVEPKRARFMSTTGTQDKIPDDDQIPVTHQPSGIAPVQKLKPSQSSMNIEKALAFAIQMLHPKGKLKPGGDLGAFISSDDYIMDGHHRWVATAMVNPALQMGGYKVEFPGQQLVAILNAMTKGLFGRMRGKKATGGFEQFQEGPIRKQLQAYVQNGVWKNLGPADVLAVLEKFTEQKGEAAVEAAVQKFVQNLETLTFEVPSWASDRVEMPVIDGPKQTAKAAKALDQGVVNVNPPYKPQQDPYGISPATNPSRKLK